MMHFMGRITSPPWCRMCVLTPCSSRRRTTRPSPLHLYRRNPTHLQIQPQKYKGTCTQRPQRQPHERDIRQDLRRIRNTHIRIRHRVCKIASNFHHRPQPSHHHAIYPVVQPSTLGYPAWLSQSRRCGMGGVSNPGVHAQCSRVSE